MLNPRRFDTADELHHGMCDSLLFGTRESVDWDTLWIDGVLLHNVSCGVDSFRWDYDLSNLWFAKTRWVKLVRQYIDPVQLENWLALIKDRMSPGMQIRRAWGQAVLRTNLVDGHGEGSLSRRRWGSCMLDLIFRIAPYPQITLNSRATYFGNLAALDMSVAYVAAQYASEITGIDVQDMRFVWNIESAQWHAVKSLPYALGTREFREMYGMPKAKIPPGVWRSSVGYSRFVRSDEAGRLYGDESFASVARLRQRYHVQTYGLAHAAQFLGGNRVNVPVIDRLPRLHTDELDFGSLWNNRRKPEEGC